MLARIAAALLSVIILVVDHRITAKGLPFIRHGPIEFGRNVVILLVANVLVWLSQRTDWSLRTRFQLAGIAWIWLIVQLGCAIYVLQNLA